MFNQKIDKQILLQYVLLVSFCLVFIFAPLGDITIDFGDVYYVLPPEGGFYNDSIENASLSLGIKGNLIICALAVLEGIMITLSKKGVFTGVWICLSRQLYLAYIMLLNIVSAITAGFSYKGTVATVAALPSSGKTQGDCYTVTENLGTYVWDGTAWFQYNVNLDLILKAGTEATADYHL